MWFHFDAIALPAMLSGTSCRRATSASVFAHWCCMLPVRCTNCGLINIPERQTCQRCQALLQRPLAEDSAQVTAPDQSLSYAQSLTMPGHWGSFAFSRTISSPLPFMLAQHRLAMLLELADAGQLQRSGFSFHGERNGDTFRLY